MDIVIDLTSITAFFSQPAEVILEKFIFYFGWIPICLVFLTGSFNLWVYYRQINWAEKNAKFTLLAIDIPRLNEQSPKAVENLLNYLAGGHGVLNLIEKYWDGAFQLSFSLEIISVEGYTQFLIRTPVRLRNLAESAVYSQYPDAEITEVDDYINDYKKVRFPNEKYDIWGSEFILTQNNAYPIKTYKEFEHMVGPPEMQFKDPMASLMDLMGSLGKGEQFWYQIILRPIGFDWMDKLDEEANKILKEKPKFKKNILSKALDFLLAVIQAFSKGILGGEEGEAVEEKTEDPLKMMQLKPKDKKRVEAIHEKTSKVAFDFKIRMVYLSEKDLLNKGKVVLGFVGYIKQFSALDLNSFKPDSDITATSTAYFFKKGHLIHKKNRIFHNYIERDIMAGRSPGIMNIEEIATIWHFPIEGVVKAPMMQRTAGRKAEAPMSLPMAEEMVSGDNYAPLFLDENEPQARPSKTFEDELKEDELKEAGLKESVEEDVFKGAPPSNLPMA